MAERERTRELGEFLDKLDRTMIRMSSPEDVVETSNQHSEAGDKNTPVHGCRRGFRGLREEGEYEAYGQET